MKKVTSFIAVIVLLLTLAAPVSASKNDSSYKETLELLNMLGDVFEKIRQEYVEEPSDKQLIEAAINGMLTDLDPHSSYLDKEAFSEMQVQTKGEFGGLGIEVTMRNGMVYVVSPIDDTPAFKAGVKAGDYFSHIDAQAVMGMSISDAVKKMRGKAGTDIVITILREGEKEPFDVTITRDIIKLTAVRSRAEGDVGYVRVTSFTEKAGPALRKAVKEIKKEIGRDLKGFVLDLRNNPGGLLSQAIEVTEVFLDQGEVVSTKGRKEDSAKRFFAKKGDLIGGLPLVVLINGGSASASEIVAGALQDHKRAIVLGTKSFGKGSVQTIIPLKESAIRITTSRYYTPSGNSIQAKGIKPDVIVEPAKIEIIKSTRRMAEANLKGHLSGGGKAKNEENKDKGEKKKSAEENQKDAKNILEKINNGKIEDEDKPLYERDYQLARAIDLLRGIYIYNLGDRAK